MKKKLWQLMAAFVVLVMLCFCVACAQQTQTLTDLLMEVNNLPQLVAEGEVTIKIDDLGMEQDFAEDDIPSDLLKDTTIKYEILCNYEQSLAKVSLEADFACFDDNLYCTFYVLPEHVYLNAQDFLAFIRVFSTDDEYAEAQQEIGDIEWLDLPLEEDVYASTETSKKDWQMIVDETDKIRSTIGKAYADFKVDGIKSVGNGFELDLDNAGLAKLINEFMDYTIDNYDSISLAMIAYINSSSLFDVYDREQLIDSIQSMADFIKNDLTLQDRMEMATIIEEAFTAECPIDFALKYHIAKTDISTYTLDESVSLYFLEDYFGYSSKIYLGVKNTTKAAENLEIVIPTEKIASVDELSDDFSADF